MHFDLAGETPVGGVVLEHVCIRGNRHEVVDRLHVENVTIVFVNDFVNLTTNSAESVNSFTLTAM